MQIDELILKLKSDFNKVVSDANSLISKFTKLDNSTSKVSSDFENISKSASSMGNGFKNAKQEIASLERQLKEMTTSYKADLKYFNERAFVGATKVEDLRGLTDAQKRSTDRPDGIKFITKDSLLQEKQDIDALQSKISELKAQVSSVPKLKVVPNTKEGEQNIKNVGDEANKTGRKFDNLSNKTRKVGSSFSSASGSFKDLKKGFSGLGNKISSSMDRGLKSVKKLALGLVGVRTVMSLLTRSVNAYLSFDGELQNSLSNSWNMLGSLLAPAIELVANLFATATNYIYRFVQALTGIDLVARANAKALQTQAKATKKTADAQRGLLGMDEITNLPTEPGGKGTETPQITVKDINTKGIFSELIKAFKSKQWHRAGEIIAEGINNALRKIDWDYVRHKAETTGKNIADFLNGVFELDWRLLGSSIANTINTAIDFIHGFVTKLDWGQIGTGIGQGIMSFFETFDFGKLADTINTTMKGLLTLFENALDNSDATEMGEKIGDFLLRIEWQKISDRVADAFGKALAFSLEGLWAILKKLIVDYIYRTVPEFKKGGMSFGKAIANSFVLVVKTYINGLIWSLNSTMLPAFATISGLAKLAGKDVSVKSLRLPYLATGTNNIEQEGIYHLHEGEAVVPKKYNPATGGYNDGNDNREIINLLVALNSTMLEYAERPIRLDINGRKVAEGIYDDMRDINRNKNYSSAVTRS